MSLGLADTNSVCVCARVHVHARELFSQIPWTIACQAPLSTEFSRQEYWSGEG